MMTSNNSSHIFSLTASTEQRFADVMSEMHVFYRRKTYQIHSLDFYEEVKTACFLFLFLQSSVTHSCVVCNSNTFFIIMLTHGKSSGFSSSVLLLFVIFSCCCWVSSQAICLSDKDCNYNGVCDFPEGLPENATDISGICKCVAYFTESDCSRPRKSQFGVFLSSFIMGWLGMDRFILGYIGLGCFKLLLTTIGSCVGCLLGLCLETDGGKKHASRGISGCFGLGLLIWWIVDFSMIVSGDLYESDGTRLFPDMEIH